MNDIVRHVGNAALFGSEERVKGRIQAADVDYLRDSIALHGCERGHCAGRYREGYVFYPPERGAVVVSELLRHLVDRGLGHDDVAVQTRLKSRRW